MSIAFGSITLSCVNDGEPGRNGVGISSTVVEYATGSSQTVPPEHTLVDENNTVLVDGDGAILTNGQWQSEIPVVYDGMYLWSRTITTYDDGTFSISYSVSRDGIGILTESRQYYLSDSPTTLSGGSWTYDQPYPIPTAKYMWGRLEFKMTDGTTTYSDAVYENSLSGIINKTDAIEGKITQKIWQTDIASAIDDYDTLEGNTTVRERISEFSQDLDGIHTTIGDKTSSPSGILERLSRVSQTADKISWLVKSGDNISNMVLTDEMFNLITRNINISGKVTFSAFDSEAQQKFNDIETDVSNINIRDFKQEYGYSTSRTVQPSSWQTNVPEAAEGRYIWQKTTYSTKTGQRIEEIVCLTGQKGDTGPAGSSVTAYTLEVSHAAVAKAVNGLYNPSSITLTAKSKTGTAASDYSGRFVIETSTNGSTWKNPPDYTSSINEANHNFTIPSGTVAIRCSLYAAGGTTTLLDQQTVPVVNDGANGGKGEDAYTIILTNEAHTFIGNSSTVIPASVNCGVIAYKGATQIAAHIGEITGKPSGLSTSIANNDTTTARFTVTVTSSLASNNGTLTVPIVADGKQFTKYFSYSVSLKGATGAQGPAGKGITNTNITYCVGESGTEAPGGYTIWADGDGAKLIDGDGAYLIDSTWSTTIPDVPDGSFLWVRKIETYSDGSSTTSYSVARSGVSGGDAYTVMLTNESHTFLGTEDHAVGGTVIFEVAAYKGAGRIEATIGNISSTSGGGSVTVTGMSVTVTENGTKNPKISVTVTDKMKDANGILYIPITVDGNIFTKEFTYSVAFKGKDGKDAKVRYLEVSNVAIVRDSSGTYTPNYIQVGAKERSGTSAMTGYSGRFKIETTENFTNWTARYTTPSDVSAYIYSNFPANIKAIRCSLYEAGGTTVLLDQQTVAIVENGSEGRGVASIEYYYCLSKNKPVTNPIDDKVNWSTTPQKYDDVSKKYWTCTVTTYSDGSKVASTIVEDSGANSMNEYAMLAYQAAGTSEQILKVWTKDSTLADTTIDGGFIKTHTIDSERLKTDAIMSGNYDPYSGGKASYNIALSNDMHTFTTGGSSTIINVVGYKGRTKVATRVALKNAAPSGMTCSISDNNTVNTKCTVTTSSSFNRSGSLTFVVTVGSGTEAYSVERTFTYNVSSVNRQLSLIYIVDTSSYPVSVIEKKTDNTFNPDNISVQATAIPGGIYNGRFRIETTANIEDNPENTYWASQYESSQDEFMYRYTTIPDKVKAIRFSLYASGGFTTLLDQQTVLVATDFAAFSGQGTYLDLATGNFYSPNFAVINTAPSDTGFNKGTYMGPWRVTEDAIWKISQKFKNYQANSAYFGNEGISITDKFSVDKTGYLETKKGKIGDWYIDDDNGYLRSADSTVILSPKSTKVSNDYLYAKFGGAWIDTDGGLYARSINLEKWISSNNIIGYTNVLRPQCGKELGVDTSTNYNYVQFGSLSAWIAAGAKYPDTGKMYLHANEVTYNLGTFLLNAVSMRYSKSSISTDTFSNVQIGKIYFISIYHTQFGDSNGLYMVLGGKTTYCTIIGGANLRLTVTADSIKFEDTKNTSSWYIYY